MLYKETNEMSFTSHYKDSDTVYGDNIISNCKNVINLIDKDQIKKMLIIRGILYYVNLAFGVQHI
jgi:hypothetical protein